VGTGWVVEGGGFVKRRGELVMLLLTVIVPNISH
jgi:hypothetical protein